MTGIVRGIEPRPRVRFGWALGHLDKIQLPRKYLAKRTAEQ